ncbi:MAG: hypothetical protein LC541_07990 [Candidatus Thiodiazotropha sp.]|nr:hypothetical protein [Candidatus Thiodiazotropha sp.]MCM8883221.1 hypothetical protein [Candidatus Thiodiazotropha sp.]MCM8920617.1 hypothetical protein [Candidatus Thiodiazotropha sp.]
MSKTTDFPYFKLWFIYEHPVDYISDRDIVWTDFDELEWSQQHTLINAIITLGEELGLDVRTKFALLPNDDDHRHPGFRLIWSDDDENRYFYYVVYLFLQRITSRCDDETRDLFFEYELSEWQYALLERAINRFLITLGGKSIKIPFQLKSEEECILKLSGQFAPKPRKNSPQDGTVKANGLVETLSRNKRFVEILSKDGDELRLSINVEFFFWQLHSHHGTDEWCEFIWSEIYNDAGKQTRTLTGFRVLESAEEYPEVI